MKKGKIVALLSLSVLTLGVVAGGIAAEGGFLTELEAGEQQADKTCALVFDKNSKTVSGGSVTNIRNKNVVLQLTTDVYDYDGGLCTLNSYYGNDESTYISSGTNYDAKKGFGDFIHGIKSYEVNFGDVIGGCTIFFGYEAVAGDDTSIVWAKQEYVTTENKNYYSGKGHIDGALPDAFKIVADQESKIDIKSIEIEATTLEDNTFTSPLIAGKEYSAKASVTTFNMTSGLDGVLITPQDYTFKVNNDGSINVKTYDAESKLIDKTLPKLYPGRVIDDYGRNLYTYAPKNTSAYPEAFKFVVADDGSISAQSFVSEIGDVTTTLNLTNIKEFVPTIDYSKWYGTYNFYDLEGAGNGLDITLKANNLADYNEIAMDNEGTNMKCEYKDLTVTIIFNVSHNAKLELIEENGTYKAKIVEHTDTFGVSYVGAEATKAN